MPPNSSDTVYGKSISPCETVIPRKPKVRYEIIWKYVVLYVVLHIGALYGIYRLLTAAMYKTTLFGFIIGKGAGLGITAGAHRLWCHRSYKAKLPLRIFLVFLHTMAYMKDVYSWARDHRVHHKFSETDADPHNANRGFFFAHAGWLMVRKHPDVIEKGKTIDASDILADPVIQLQRKYYTPLAIVLSIIIPTIIPIVFWGETFQNSFFVATVFRYVLMYNLTSLVNSAAHLWGNRPYDKNINPADNPWVVACVGGGEGHHNYHHTFPWDYASSEFGCFFTLTTSFIKLAAMLGLAYDLKTASKETILQRKLKNR